MVFLIDILLTTTTASFIYMTITVYYSTAKATCDYLITMLITYLMQMQIPISTIIIINASLFNQEVTEINLSLIMSHFKA